MAEASTESSLDWCRARYLVPGHPLTLTLPYADPADRDALLALRALIGEIAAVPGDVSEPDVARRKLGWWMDALDDHLPHPVIQAYLESGAAERAPTRMLGGLVAAVRATIDAPRFDTEAELDRHARALAAPAAQAEAALVAPDGVDTTVVEELERMAAAAYRIRLARDLVLDARHGRWSVPLELRAEFQLTRAQVAEGDAPHRVRALLAHLAGQGVQAIEAGRQALPTAAAWRHRHAVLTAELDRRLGLLLVRKPSRALEQRLSASGPRAAFGLWRQARRLRRAAR
ncbi:squalene/phytoene synthase family protein [Wenzhouxiangella sp. XN79A]|uniref:squalene/phytoene synthase family protein n=1 Tax=Wenzhouxiangella sp. XN79A TaxID=2724193 RepID=UPI00144A907F|nr:squalene/phytoene synthase family protein [Wenzhouxiangella sp. XN79A]NKI36022.1 squalene/phytoene synthase family protein [Wenzhouxiangella sp. XN79A]